MRRLCCIGAIGLLVGCSEGGEAVGTARTAVEAAPRVPALFEPGDEVPGQSTVPADTPIPVATVGLGAGECGIPGGSAADPSCNFDGDGDTVVAQFDCDDANPAFFPFAIDTRCDGMDQNCNGLDECDRDDDGILSVWDCDDDRPDVGLECRPWHTADGPVNTL